MRLTHTALLVPLALGLVACGTSDSNDAVPSKTQATEQAPGPSESSSSSQPPAEQQVTVDDIKVEGAFGKKPTVSFSTPASVATTESKVIDGQGSGPRATESATVTADFSLVDAHTGKTVQESFTNGQSARFTLGSQLLPGLNKGLEGAQAGQRLVVVMPAADAFGEQGQGQAIKPGDALVWVVDVVKVEPLQVMDAPAPSKDVPTIVEKGGDPTGFKATPTTPKSADELAVWTVKQGNGPVVQTGQTIEVNYLGALYPDGKVFDESYSRGQTASFPIGVGQVIPGWDKALVGQKVGSRVIIEIPSDLGYGAAGSPPTIPGNADLIFLVDIVGVQ